MTGTDAVSIAAALPVAGYIAFHRALLAPFGAPLAPELRVELSGYFSASDLDSVLVVETKYIPALSRVAAITFGNVIATRQPMDARLAFHEMVHVVQYRLLGVFEFARQYARGYLISGEYMDIPLECNAHALEARFLMRLGGFDVEAEVERAISNRSIGES